MNKMILLISARYDSKVRLALIEKIIELDYKIENQITIDYGEQRKIKNAVNSRVIKRLAGKESQAYKSRSTRGLYYAAIYRTVYETFGVNSYRDIKRKDLEDCINLINAWIEPLKIESEKVS
jgi:7-cyano-7-deazaguanine synthase in queuosine biosynthesis